MKMLSFILVLLLGGVMPAGNLLASDKEQNPHYITVKNSRDLQAYFRYAPDRPIVISGHRGGMLDGYPENCIESFEKTLSYMESFFEIDPRLTKDGIIVLMHDETIDRIRLAALVAGDDAGRYAGGAHQEDKGRGVVLAEAAPGVEQEVVDRLLAEQRRLQCVEKIFFGK